jgi:hypothetical protein
MSRRGIPLPPQKAQEAQNGFINSFVLFVLLCGLNFVA